MKFPAAVPLRGGEAYPRSRAIDTLRAVAILLVIGCHFAVAPASAGAFAPLAEAWHRVGWAGVDLFFVLSGFLVSGLLLGEFRRRGRVDVPRFLIRRGLKIWPLYFAYLGFLAAWLAWKSPDGRMTAVGALWPNLLHLQNYLGSPRIHTWSLALEEHFYLLGAVAAGWFLTAGREAVVRRWFFPAVGVAIAALAVTRSVEYATHGPASLNLYATHLRFDGLLVGTALAYLVHFEPTRLAGLRRHPFATTVLGAAMAIPMMLLPPDRSPWTAGPGLAVMYLGFAFVVIGVVWLEEGSARRLFAGRSLGALSTVGVFSYGIYLWHVDLAQTPMKKVGALLASRDWSDAMVWLLVTGAYLALAIAAGAVLSRLIEIPMLVLRDRCYPSADRAEVGHAPARPIESHAPTIAGARARCRTARLLE